ncbi:MAG: translocation and assembly module TamA [Paracoccaceae bacterium]|jgi:translocation and assembly module TamA
MMIRFSYLALIALAPFVLTACTGKPDTSIEELPFARAQSAVPYEPVLEGAPNAAIEDLTRQSLRLWRRQEDGANSIALLRRRADQDVEIAVKILRSFGWYEAAAEVEVTAPSMTPQDIAAREQAQAAYQAALAARPTGGREASETPKPQPPAGGPEARAVLRMIPGPRYTLTEHRFIIVDQGRGAAPELPPAAALGSPIGTPAAAAAILLAENAALARLRADGRPWAERRSRRAIADPDAKTLEVETVIASGPRAVFGDITISGAEGVSDAYLRSYKPWEDGAPTNPADLRAYQQDLSRTDLFGSVTVRLPATPPENPVYAEDGAIIAPVLAQAEERAPRTVSAGLRFTEVSGPEARFGFVHRNLFNAGERFEGELQGGLTEQSLDLSFAKPQFRRPKQELQLAVGLFNEEIDAYESTGVKASAAVQRRLSDTLIVGAGGLAEFAHVGQNGPREEVILFGLPIYASYDGSDDKLDPKDGIRSALTFTPFVGMIDSNVAPFFKIDSITSAYVPLDDARDWVLAGRVRLASILSTKVDDVPANRRLYSGGGGSVRGYRQNIIGPLDDQGAPTGGRSALELGAELRTPLYGALRGAIFAEAGAVSDEMVPVFDEGMQFAAGFGVRYLSPAGPLRLDIAIPLNPREEDDILQFYLSIGQAW